MASLKPAFRHILLTSQPCLLSRPIILSIRHVHTSTPRSSTLQASSPSDIIIPTIRQPSANKPLPPLSVLPTIDILRSYLITRVTSSPLLLTASFATIKRMLDPNAVLLNPGRNPLLRWLFKHTFYAQFCSGETRAEVQRKVKNMKNTGYTGVILELALEVLNTKGSAAASTAQELAVWRQGMLETIDMSSPGDFVALKWSGIGREALRLLDEGKPPTQEMHDAIIEICRLAAKKDAALLPGAELEATNVGIDRWTIDLQRKYNKAVPGKALMYTTYQVCLRSTPKNIARDLAIAQKEGFTLGVKLVRGAYLWSEPKGACCGTKENTDAAYDTIAEALLRRQYNNVLKPVEGASAEFPNIALVIASHNAVSVEKARAIRSEQAAAGQPRIECAYAQLQGMADEISCSLVAASKQQKEVTGAVAGTREDLPRAFKSVPWGTISQCLNYLYRRALENKDAAGRTIETRKAMGKELARRAKAAVGWG